MGRNRKRAARDAALLEADHKIQEERLRIAGRIAQALREAGYACELSDDGRPPMRKRKH